MYAVHSGAPAARPTSAAREHRSDSPAAPVHPAASSPTSCMPCSKLTSAWLPTEYTVQFSRGRSATSQIHLEPWPLPTCSAPRGT
eukprot:scaffold217_cov377-Prasinococcus_capsulatus_cf.AAC.11